MDYNENYINCNGNKTIDYNNGYCVRFADDVCIMARTKEDAYKFKNIIDKFVKKRGLRLSEKKTKIVNIKEGFEFLSRFYCKIDGIVRCIPGESAVKNFEREVQEIIFSNKKDLSQRKLIVSLNAKIAGFTTYHKCEEAMDTFKYLDVVISALLLKLLRELYPNMKKEQLLKKYWKKDSQGRDIFSFNSNRNIELHNMADTILSKELRIDTSKNIFIDRKYFEELEKRQEIQNVAGRYRKVWDKQEGKCYICSKAMTREQEKAIIYKKSKRDKSIKNIAYVHDYCRDSTIEYVKTDDENIKSVNIKELINEIVEPNKKQKESKFIKLSEYFHNVHKNKVSLTFKYIEKIIGFKLCDSAYKYSTYFTNKQKGSISESWRGQGFKVSKVDMEKQKIEFIRVEFKRTRVQIPKWLYRTNLQMELVDEIKQTFLYLQEKYRIS